MKKPTLIKLLYGAVLFLILFMFLGIVAVSNDLYAWGILCGVMALFSAFLAGLFEHLIDEVK